MSTKINVDRLLLDTINGTVVWVCTSDNIYNRYYTTHIDITNKKKIKFTIYHYFSNKTASLISSFVNEKNEVSFIENLYSRSPGGEKVNIISNLLEDGYKSGKIEKL